MLPARWKTFIPAIVLAGFAAVQPVEAVPGPKAITRPVGFTTLAAPANSDVNVSPCFTRPVVYSGTVAGVSGAEITAAGNPAWTFNIWVPAGPSQRDNYYVQFTSGAAAGRCYFIAANTSQKVMVEWNGETPAVAAADSFVIIPYSTLGTLFPAADAGTAFTASSSESAHGTELLYIDRAAFGINSPISATYYFFNGAWRKVGEPTTDSYDSAAVAPGSYIIQRNKGTSTVVAVYGRVPSGTISTLVRANGGATKQDNIVSLSLPLTVTLDNSNLRGSGAFDLSTSAFDHSDELYVFDNTASGIKKAASAVYYYYNNAWRKVGAPVTSDFGATPVFVPGTGVIIRKSGTNSAAADAYWTYTSPVN